MASFEQSRLVNATVPMVWQVVSDMANWPALYEELVRVQVGPRAGDQVEVTGTDARSRSFAMSVNSSSSTDASDRAMTITFDPAAGHPLGYQSLVWTVTQSGDQTQVALAANYNKPVMLVGTLMNRLRGYNSATYNLTATLDAVVRQSQEQALKYHETVQTILSRKGTSVISARPADQVSLVCELINTHRIGAVLVLDDSENLVGLVSERDIVYHLARTGPAILDQRVEHIMTRNLIVCEPESDLLFVMACMTDNKVRHLPVIEHNELRGVISIGDVVQQRMHALEAQSDTLRHYIAAREWRFHGHRTPGSETVAPTADVAT